MKRESRTVTRSHRGDSPTQRHLPLVDLLVDTWAELMQLAVASRLEVLTTAATSFGMAGERRKVANTLGRFWLAPEVDHWDGHRRRWPPPHLAWSAHAQSADFERERPGPARKVAGPGSRCLRV